MANQGITTNRLKNLRWLDMEIKHCVDELAHGNLISESSVREWATQAKKHLPTDKFMQALKAIKETQNILKSSLKRDIQERDSILAWIEAIPNDDTRASMFLHYAKGYTWEEIAGQYFDNPSSYAAIRKACYRYIRGEHIKGKIECPPKKRGNENDIGTVKESPGD